MACLLFPNLQEIPQMPSAKVGSRVALKQLHVQMASIRRERPSRKQISRLSAAIELLAVVLERQDLK